MSDAQSKTTAEAFSRDPFSNPPPCLRDRTRACLDECEHGLAGPCLRQRRAEALSELARMDGETL
jgi:hypothetical protein